MVAFEIRCFLGWCPVLVVSVLILFSGCRTMPAQKTVQPGDKVLVDYTCQLKNGDLILTTDKDTAESEIRKKSQAFFEKKVYRPVELTEGSAYKGEKHGALLLFENEVQHQIARQLKGIPMGETVQMTLQSEIPEGLTKEDRYLDFTMVRKQPKYRKIPMEIFLKKLGRKPTPGEVFYDKPPYKGVVESIEGDKVLSAFIVENGTILDYNYGKGEVTDKGDYYEIRVKTETGHLVRLVEILGSVSRVGDTMLTVDYGHPFGGETLSCEVTVTPYNPDTGKEGSGVK